MEGYRPRTSYAKGVAIALGLTSLGLACTSIYYASQYNNAMQRIDRANEYIRNIEQKVNSENPKVSYRFRSV